jgi:hypothetical protein
MGVMKLMVVALFGVREQLDENVLRRAFVGEPVEAAR